MFLFEKYRPNNIHDFLFNKEIMCELSHIASYENVPHIIISGPPGGGKKTIVKSYLELLYDTDVNILSKNKYEISGSSTKKEIEIMQSNYHIVIEPTNTNHDKYILQEIIKKYAMYKQFDIFKTKRQFKTIVIYNIENLSIQSQAALRRTMELYATTCRFVMVCNNLSKIFDPLRSRCRTFCVSLPTLNDISNVINYISIMENIDLTSEKKNLIMDNCEYNLKKAIWILDSIRLNVETIIPLDTVFNTIVEQILDAANNKNVVKMFDDEIKTNIYDILITNIKGSEIITRLMDQLIHKINNDNINSKIIQFASEADDNRIYGRRDIIHIDFFIISVIRELKNAGYKPVKIKSKKK